MVRRRIGRREKGAATVEYAGIAFVVLALMLAIGAVTLSGSGIASAIVCKIGEAIGAESCSVEDSEHSVVPQPGDVVVNSRDESHSAKGGVSADIGAAKAGVSVTDGGTQSYRRNADGTGTITIGESWSGGVHGSVGKDIDKGNVEVALKAGVEGEITYNSTKEYNCRYNASPGERDCEGWTNKYRRQLEDQRAQGIGGMVNGSNEIPENPDSMSELWQGKINLSAEAGVEFEQTKVGEVNVGASGKVEGGARWENKYSVKENGDRGEKTGSSETYFYSVGGEIGATAELFEQEIGNLEIEGAAGAKVSGDLGMEASYERDADGNLTTVTFTTTSNVAGGVKAGVEVEGEDKKGEDTSPGQGGLDGQAGRSVETTVKIDMSSLSDAERATVENYVNSFQGATPVLPAAAYNPSKPADPNDALGTIIHNKAVVTTSVYSTTSQSEEGTFDAWFASYTTASEYNNKTLVSQQYLAEPGPDGNRVYVDTPGVDKP